MRSCIFCHSQLLLLLLVGLQFKFSGVAGNITLDYQVIDDSEPNTILLECFNDAAGVPNPDAVFEFFNPVTGILRGLLSSLGADDHLRIEVTPATEAVIRCKIGEAHSQNVSIAGE